MLLRVIQTMISSSSSPISSPLQRRWKPPGSRRRITNTISFLSTFSKPSSSSSTSQRAPVGFRSFRLSAVCSDSSSDDVSGPSSKPAFKSPAYFCQWCGGTTKQDIPDGDDKPRAICTSCGKVTYQNPKMVTGCLIEHDDKILLCKRKIPPSYGLWTLPAGYMEMGESAIEGATRETWEEAGAQVEVISPFAQLDIPLIGQTYVIFRARLKTPHFSPGPESIECRLFALEDIPFESLAFSSMLVTLNLYIEDLKVGQPKFHYGTINKRPGTGPSDIHSYHLDDHFCC